MAFSNGLKSPRDESFPFGSPIRTMAGQYTPQLPTSSSTTERASLHRRFTTNTVPTLPTMSSLTPLSPIGQQRRQAAEQHGDNTREKLHLLHQKREEYERLRLTRERFRSEMELSSRELQQLESEIGRLSFSGHQSEPTTPPDYRDKHIGSNAGNRTNRFSLNSMASPLQGSNASFHRNTLSGSQHNLGFFSQADTQTPTHSLPASHRNSDEEEDDDGYGDLPGVPRRSAVRNSMPVTNFDYRGMSSLPDVASVLGINNINSINSLLDDDDYPLPTHRHTASIDNHSLLQMERTKDEFPVLRTRNDYSGTSAKHSVSNSQASINGLSSWNNLPNPGHRQGQKSLPLNVLRTDDDDTPRHSRNSSAVFDTPARNSNNNKANNRHSMELGFGSPATQSNRSSLQMSPPGSGMPNLRSSLSTNDIPTMSNLNLQDQPAAAPSHLTQAEQRLHNHNANLGRIPPNAGHRRDASINNRQSLGGQQSAAVSNGNYSTASNPNNNGYATANANGNSRPSTGYGAAPASGHTVSSGGGMAQQNLNGGWQLPMYGMPQQGAHMPHAQPWGAPAPNPYQQPYQQFFYPSYPVPSRPVRDSQQMVIAARRGESRADPNRPENRFNNSPLESHIGDIFAVSKDQNGCRYLQKKIEEDKATNLPLIFEETKHHIVELMKDPFGNYLCQKLLENCDAAQRTILINHAAPSMVEIAVNQHGTRALQKMIEFVTTAEQVSVIVDALRKDVVTLIQDLNGNHVIQKCLNHLRPDDAQFIFDAVGNNAVTVGTHRHGCCVLQRCIDHATGTQKENLIAAITRSAYQLMQDPFGNYVIQYILDLHLDIFTGPLCQVFRGHVMELSRQKFSSNVIEKSIRMAEPYWRGQLLIELCTNGQDLEALLRDPFANYVMQTAIEHGPTEVVDQLWEIIIPILPNIRNTPCGRRLMTKLNQRDGIRSGQTSGTMTPKEGIRTPATNGQLGAAPPGPAYNNLPPAVQTYTNMTGMPRNNHFAPNQYYHAPPSGAHASQNGGQPNFF